MRIVVICGTNRAESKTRRIAQHLHQQYAALDGVEATLLDLAELPMTLLSPQAYADKPPGFRAFAEAILAADGLVVITPEYNGGMPGVLKLFIDMLPFPESFEHRPVCFVGLSAGRWGALRPVEQLQSVFGYRNAHIYPNRVFMPGIHRELDAQGHLVDDAMSRRLSAQMTGFVDFCRAVKPLR